MLLARSWHGVEIVKYLPYAKPTRPGSRMKTVRGVVNHFVNNPGTSALANRSYFESIGRSGLTFASCHYIVDLDGKILKIIPESESAYHAGGRHYTELAIELFADQSGFLNPHDKTIGIEVCHPDNTGKFTPATYEAWVWLNADILFRHNLKPDAILRHYDVTGKNCPAWYVQHPEEWEQFVKDVMETVDHWRESR